MRIEMPGDLDGDGVRRIQNLCQAWVHESGPELIVDLGRVTYMDSCGIGLLVHLYKRKLERGQTFRIENVSGQPLFLLERFDLLRLFKHQPINREARSLPTSPEPLPATS